MDIHKMMVIVAALILILAMGIYYSRPGDDIATTIIATCLGFLFGKATNGIRSHPSQAPQESRRRRSSRTKSEVD